MVSALDLLFIWVGKAIGKLSRFLGLGFGGTWSGHFVFTLRPSLLAKLGNQLACGSIFVTGTNGKTTTALMLKLILTKAGFKVVHNPSGANLLNGIVSSLVLDSDFFGRPLLRIGVFEIDEANFPLALKAFSPEVVLLLNLSRDQLDRYGEVDFTLERWRAALAALPKTTSLVINGDEEKFRGLLREISSIKYQVSKFSKDKPQGFASPLPGDFNQLNTNAAVAAAKILGIDNATIREALADFKPAFGRGEELKVKGREIRILLAKNPASFNANLKLLFHLLGAASALPKGTAPAVLIALNDNIPDGRDVSWIWDIDFERHRKWLGRCQLLVSGKRAWDLALRLKYTGIASNQLLVISNLRKAIEKGLERADENGFLHILPTYSAMLEIRKILTGRAIGTPDG